MLRDKLLARLGDAGSAPDYQRLASEVLGIRGASPSVARKLVEQALVVEDRREHWRAVGERAKSAAPAAPAVYVFRDSSGAAIYVGKAVNLRRRLAAHFSVRRWRELPPAMARVELVEWQLVGSEIEALLREATLIRDLRPSVNIQTAAPALETRAIANALVRDVVLLVPSAAPDIAEVIAARRDGGTFTRRMDRRGADLSSEAAELWAFFRPRPQSIMIDDAFAPLVFSWLAGRGQGTTRIDPHDAASADDLRRQLESLLRDKDLFAERLNHIIRTRRAR
jgi:predicted GIY-YIG superfamily endonuclease